MHLELKCHAHYEQSWKQKAHADADKWKVTASAEPLTCAQGPRGRQLTLKKAISPCYREIVKKSITSISARFLSGFIEVCRGRFATSFSMEDSFFHSQALQCLLLYPGTAPGSKTLSVWVITKHCSMTSSIRDPRIQTTAPGALGQRAPLPRHTHAHITLPWIQFLGIDPNCLLKG